MEINTMRFHNDNNKYQQIRTLEFRIMYIYLRVS